LIKLYKENYLLPRFIFENEKILISIYGKKGYEGLLNELYRDSKKNLLSKAAESYLASEYYDTARRLFQKVFSLSKDDRKIHFLYMYTSAFHFYFKNRFSRSLVFAEHASSIDASDMSIDVYRRPLQILISDLSKELKRMKKK